MEIQLELEHKHNLQRSLIEDHQSKLDMYQDQNQKQKSLIDTLKQQNDDLVTDLELKNQMHAA